MTVAITHSKEMSSSIFSNMRKHKERILIHLLLLWWVPCFGCKGKLGDTVIKLFAWLSRLLRCWSNRSWYLFRNRCSYILWTSLALLATFFALRFVHSWINSVILVHYSIIFIFEWFSRSWRLSPSTISLVLLTHCHSIFNSSYSIRTFMGC